MTNPKNPSFSLYANIFTEIFSLHRNPLKQASEIKNIILKHSKNKNCRYVCFVYDSIND